jgi:hypothetical protein
MATLQTDHEPLIVRAFIQKSKQSRCIEMLSSQRHRRKFTAELAHFKWLDERFAHLIPASTAHTAEELARLLRSKGASESVWVISEDTSIDARDCDLDTAIRHILGRGMGTILSCIPGKLAYFEDEDEQLLLERAM